MTTTSDKSMGPPEASREEVHYVDPALYEKLAADPLGVRRRAGPSDPEASQAAAPTLYFEARLLDERRYRDWLSLLAPDCIYWIPSNPDRGDPRAEGAINFDDRRRLVDRVVLIETGSLHAQIPPSRTSRMVTNIEAWWGEHGGLHVRSNLTITEFRRGVFSRYVGWQEHELIGPAGGWRIRTKIITLLDCDQPIGNITFIL